MTAVFEPDTRIKEVHIEGLVSYFYAVCGWSIVFIRLSACSPVRFVCSIFCSLPDLFLFF
jgi:hypothetical protein